MLYKDIAPLVAIDAMGAPMPRIIGAIGQAANEFFRRTMAYKLSLPQTQLDVGQRRVPLQVPATTFLVGVTGVTYGGVPIDPATSLPIDWENLTGTPRNYLVSGGGDGQDYVEEGYLSDDYFLADGPLGDTFDSVRMIPYLAVAEPNAIVQVDYAVAPILTATSIPDAVGFRYQDALVCGAKAYLLGDTGKDWSNPGGAGMYRTIFDGDIARGMRDARIAALPTQSLRVRMRRF